MSQVTIYKRTLIISLISNTIARKSFLTMFPENMINIIAHQTNKMKDKILTKNLMLTMKYIMTIYKLSNLQYSKTINIIFLCKTIKKMILILLKAKQNLSKINLKPYLILK